MKDETDLLKSTVTEYRCVVNREGDKEMGEMDMERLVRSLADAHDWTDRGARAIQHRADAERADRSPRCCHQRPSTGDDAVGDPVASGQPASAHQCAQRDC